MKKGILTLCIVGLMTSCVLAGPGGPGHHGDKHGPKHGHIKPPRVHMYYGYPRHYHNHFYYNYSHYPCACLDPYCIHRRHSGAFFGIFPRFSVGISL